MHATAIFATCFIGHPAYFPAGSAPFGSLWRCADTDNSSGPVTNPGYRHSTNSHSIPQPEPDGCSDAHKHTHVNDGHASHTDDGACDAWDTNGHGDTTWAKRVPR